MKAIWNGRVIAESDDTVVVENNHYFPEDSVNKDFLKPSPTQTVCAWKGTAHYYTIEVNNSANRDAAWYYPNPRDAAKEIEGRIAFWKGVSIEE
ncbi:MAG TPA: DUF427 domain-containing protein [Patescibacteria group bacterium]|nr:DUF427 domain-containing protein [Patescibacteria group bacterium]